MRERKAAAAASLSALASRRAQLLKLGKSANSIRLEVSGVSAISNASRRAREEGSTPRRTSTARYSCSVGRGMSESSVRRFACEEDANSGSDLSDAAGQD